LGSARSRRAPGALTRSKLAGLGGNLSGCRALLDRAGIAHVAVPRRNDGARCGYDDGVRTSTEGPLSVAFRPPVVASCPVAASLAMWEWHVVQPAAERHFGRAVTAIEDFGTYSCRRVGGAASGNGWSEHARANAIDIAGFRLEGGRHITVAGNWRDEGAAGGSCATCATAPANCSPRRCRPTTTPRTATTCTWTRPGAGPAGGHAAEASPSGGDQLGRRCSILSTHSG
jgi:hypothetical protein